MRTRKPKKWLHPYAIELDYVRAARLFAQEVTTTFASAVGPVLAHSVRLDDAEGTWREAFAQAVSAATDQLGAGIKRLWSAAKKIGGRVQKFNKAQFQQVVKRALGVDVFQAEPWLVVELEAWAAANLQLITSIPAEHAARLQQVLEDAVRGGLTARDVAKQLRAVTPLTDHRAELVARDQVGKLNSQLTQRRQQGIGVTAYNWRGVLDQRERQAHVSREGQSFLWSDPPSDGHPGQPVLCRCWPEAIFPALQHIQGMIQP